MYARALAMNTRNETLLEFSAEVLGRHGMAKAASIAVQRAGPLIELQSFEEARKTLEDAIPYLQGDLLGTAFSRLGLTLFHLGEPWQPAYERARTSLSGEELGRALLNEGYCLAQSGRGIDARNAWLEALPLFRSNPRLLAWVRYNLGISALRDLDPEAERYFLEADRLTRKPQAAGLRSQTLNGLGGSRRVLGEWSRAESCYREALRIATDAHDRKEAYLGLARTLRLARRHVEALEVLEFALHDETFEQTLLRVSHAMVFLALGQPERARDSLGRVGTLVSESDKWLERIARAELARQDGQLDEAVSLLDGLPVASLHAREEAGAFPLLFNLLESAEKPVPAPLKYAGQTVVRVTARGVLEVRVNGRGVPIAPSGRVGEFLVYLLEQGGVASLEVIGDALYAGDLSAPDHKRIRQTVWKLVKGLRDALGWQDSVRSLRGAYRLDPDAIWEYDVAEARALGRFDGPFLEGVYSDWALEVARSLEELPDNPKRPTEFN
jgi:tetratricopeptide (TPR) repeat protein